MNSDRIVGSVKVTKGRIKRAVGTAIDDDQLRVEGAADVADGQVQNGYGRLKETLKSIYVSLMAVGQRN
jgi:uncharacterized protein YjbJ (UPF0337 family)